MVNRGFHARQMDEASFEVDSCNETNCVMARDMRCEDYQVQSRFEDYCSKSPAINQKCPVYIELNKGESR